MNQQQIEYRLWQLEEKAEELESRLRTIEQIVRNIDINTADTADLVRQILQRLR